ncbi:MAG: hypothetical protein PHV51_04915 [Methanosarcinaceae archaeon]|nr:hypothetical protein [Methanosarcinaceae archaeon]
MNYKLITAGTAGRACGLVEVAPGYEAGSRSVFSRAVVHYYFISEDMHYFISEDMQNSQLQSSGYKSRVIRIY